MKGALKMENSKQKRVLRVSFHNIYFLLPEIRIKLWNYIEN